MLKTHSNHNIVTNLSYNAKPNNPERVSKTHLFLLFMKMWTKYTCPTACICEHGNEPSRSKFHKISGLAQRLSAYLYRLFSM
jgi:hypothetical protein